MTQKQYVFTDADGNVTLFETDAELPQGEGSLKKVDPVMTTQGGGGPGEVKPPV